MSAILRAVSPASSSRVATVFRKVRKVTHSNPARALNGFHARLRTLLASRTVLVYSFKLPD
jgi:hypothetical protein